MTDFAAWLNQELRDRGWSQRELARRSNMSHSSVSDVLSNVRRPSWDFCASIAGALERDPDEVFVLAGLKKPLPPSVKEEQDALRILRGFSPSARAAAMAMLRGLAGHPPGGPQEADTPSPEAHALAQRLDGLIRELEQFDPELAEQMMGSTITQTEATLAAMRAAQQRVEDEQSQTRNPS